MLGALVSHAVAEEPLRLAYAAMMLVVAWLIAQYDRGSRGRPDAHRGCDRGRPRVFTDRFSGKRYEVCAHGLGAQRGINTAGGFITGMISTGAGELTAPPLIIRSGFPVAVAAATSIVMVAVANVSASATHFVQFVTAEGLMAIPSNLIVWGVPGMAAGALLGSHLQGRIHERAARRFFAGLFSVVSLAMVAFTVFGEQG